MIVKALVFGEVDKLSSSQIYQLNMEFGGDGWEVCRLDKDKDLPYYANLLDCIKNNQEKTEKVIAIEDCDSVNLRNLLCSFLEADILVKISILKDRQIKSII